MDRQCVNDFVGDYHAPELLRQAFEKLHVRAEALRLPPAQRRARLEDEIFSLELLRKQRVRKRAAPGANFEVRSLELANLARERAPKEAAEFRRGHEVAAAAELAVAPAVIGLYDAFHVAREGNPAAIRGNLGAKFLDQHRVESTLEFRGSWTTRSKARPRSSRAGRGASARRSRGVCTRRARKC